MIADFLKEWLETGDFITVEHLDLAPVAADVLSGEPLSILSDRSAVVFFRDKGDSLWAIKKVFADGAFQAEHSRAIKSLIPHHPGFEAGYMRRVLDAGAVSAAALRDSPLPAWIHNSILMPAAAGVDWSTFRSDVQHGRQYLPVNQRLALVRSLSQEIQWLEGQDISHRDLSGGNVLVDAANGQVHLVDWEGMFRAELPAPGCLRRGTYGYIAPFVAGKGVSDGRFTWRARADRFALAVICAEILCVSAEFPATSDDGFCGQDELYVRSGPCLSAMTEILERTFFRAALLLKRALAADDFDDCPSPADWAASVGSESKRRRRPIPQRDRATFASLNRFGFTPLNKSLFVRLKRHQFAQPPYRIRLL
ncbi:MAG: hypothetical protein DMF61_15600 [Blastocatellia bacterium AA13]|nr:MAG: hypothetical protein DMF61_15600 [Blastocatellia bacterium AA13]